MWESKAKKTRLIILPDEDGLSFIIRKTGFKFLPLPTSEPIPQRAPQASPRATLVNIGIDDDDDDGDNSRKRGATPATSASQKRTRGASGSAVNQPSPAGSASHREEVQKGSTQPANKEHSVSSLPSQEATPIPDDEASTKKTSKKKSKSGRRSGSHSSHHSRSSTTPSPPKESAPKDTPNESSPTHEQNKPHVEVQSGDDQVLPFTQPDQVTGVMPHPKASARSSTQAGSSLGPQQDSGAALLSPQAKGGSASPKTAASSHASSERLNALLVQDPLATIQSFLDGTLNLDSPPPHAETTETAQSRELASSGRVEEALAKLKGLVFDEGFVDKVCADPQPGHDVIELLTFLLGQSLDQAQADALVELQTFLVDLLATLDSANAVEQLIKTKEAEVIELTARKTLIATDLSSVDSRLEELQREMAKLEKEKARLVEEGPAVNARLTTLAAECTNVMLSTSQLSKEVAAKKRVKRNLDARIVAAGAQLEAFKSRI
ncbi:uncharacterized protein LOC130712815 [Lotus japonicus]|uniref:uncharacterized protein LOC130712815 n=1 Tax=Lotus japonicus TaxID=34305 RepID=UPI0025887100|nr:uncharacterized protein LOC130712815 [Lotus japonicus]